MYMHEFLKDLFVDTYTIHAYTYNTYIYLHTYIYVHIQSDTYYTYIYLRTYKYVLKKCKYFAGFLGQYIPISISLFKCVPKVRHGSLMA